MKKILILLISVFIFYGCAISKHSSVVQNLTFDKYKYFYVSDAATTTASTGGVYGNQYGVYGSQTTKSVNPADIIAGRMMKEGFVKLPFINPEVSDETIIVSYGESGRHNHIIGYSIEVTLQFLDAKTMKVIATTSAAGMGETEADDIRKAINECFKNLFK
jgi:hypothetical protein